MSIMCAKCQFFDQIVCSGETYVFGLSLVDHVEAFVILGWDNANGLLVNEAIVAE
jgi:hypothetical protein